MEVLDEDGLEGVEEEEFDGDDFVLVEGAEEVDFEELEEGADLLYSFTTVPSFFVYPETFISLLLEGESVDFEELEEGTDLMCSLTTVPSFLVYPGTLIIEVFDSEVLFGGEMESLVSFFVSFFLLFFVSS